MRRRLPVRSRADAETAEAAEAARPDRRRPRSARRGARYDLVVIGLGSAGINAAEVAARELGVRVLAVERSRPGGDCLWTGCVPSKALLASARVAHTVRHADHHAIGAAPPEIDLAHVWSRIAAIQAEIAATDDDPDRIRSTGVELVEGTARLAGPHHVVVGDRTVETRYVLVCTGGRPWIPPIDGIDDVDVLTSENLFTAPRPPDSLVVIGGGPAGCELAQALTRLGVDVTLVERGERLLRADEPAHADRLLHTLRAEGVDVRLAARPVRVTRGGDGVNVHLEASPGHARPGDAGADGQRIVTAQGLLVTVGRRPNSAGLGLEDIGVELDDVGHVVTDTRSRTSVPSVYAVGDVTARPHFTHAAGYDGTLAVRDMFLPGRGTAPSLVPWCTFTDPEVAHVGLTEEQAVAEHGRKKVAVHYTSLEDNDRARADGDTNGEIRVVTVRGRIVGAHMMSPHAGESIHELALAVQGGRRLSSLTGLVHVYPTHAFSLSTMSAAPLYATVRKVNFLARLGRLRRTSAPPPPP